MEYCSAFKKDKNLIHAVTWMNFEDTTLSETNQMQKDKYRNDSTYMRYLEK